MDEELLVESQSVHEISRIIAHLGHLVGLRLFNEFESRLALLLKLLDLQHLLIDCIDFGLEGK